MKEKWRSSRRRKKVNALCSFIRKKVVPNVEEYDTS